MIVSTNRVVAHEGRDYHIQAEDLGEAEASFEVRVYERGTVLWRRRLSYSELVAKHLERLAFEDELRAQMEKAAHTVEAAILRGRLT